MTSISELLTNFKTLMHQYFPYTTDVNTSLNGKVDKETGKGLSTNDYTTTEKNKLAGLSNYSHPTAKQCSYSYSHPTSKQCNATIPTVDSSLSKTSTNAIQNKVIYNKVLSARNTKLTVDNYNVAIDGTCVITCTLTDIFGTAVANENVTVTCDKGYFTKYNNTSISGTTTKSKTVSTNSSGQFTLTYKASEWGLVTFSANNHTLQINVTGWKQVQNGTLLNSSGTFKVYYDGNGLCQLEVKGQATIQGSGYETTMFNVNSAYKPSQVVQGLGNSKATGQYVSLWPSGEFRIHNTQNTGNTTVEFTAVYKI